MRQLYMNLANWADEINRQSQEVYWKFIWRIADELIKKYLGNKLVFAIV